jgi:hypothetical protein
MRSAIASVILYRRELILVHPIDNSPTYIVRDSLTRLAGDT